MGTRKIIRTMKEQNQLLEVLAARHNEWVKMAKSLSKHADTGISKITTEQATDVVHDMYIKLNKYVKTPERIMFNDEEINTMFIYVTLRNLYYDSYNKNKKYKETLEFGHDHYSEDINKGDEDFSGHVEGVFDGTLTVNNWRAEEASIELQEAIKTEIESWDWYNQNIFKVIFYKENSMRSLARETGISLSSIFNTVKAGKEKLRLKFKVEYNNIQALTN